MNCYKATLSFDANLRYSDLFPGEGDSFRGSWKIRNLPWEDFRRRSGIFASSNWCSVAVAACEPERALLLSGWCNRSS